MDEASPPDAGSRPARQLAPILATVLAVFTAQQMLTPVLAPLSRELALTETQLGAVITVAALVLTVTSAAWGRALDAFGVRPVLLAGLGLATAGLAGFAVVARFGLAGATAPPTTFLLMLLTRSVVFGAGIAALPVAALSAASATSRTEGERTSAVGLVGAAQGLSLVLGPAAGGALAAASLLLPLLVAPAVTALLAVWVLAGAARTPRRARGSERTTRLTPWDRRVRTPLGIGFLLYLSLGLVQVVVGFLVADRLGLDPRATAGAIGVTLFAAGVVMVGVQGALVPRLGWPARRLLVLGAPIAAAGYAGLATAGAQWSITVAFAVLAAGLGLAMPGFTAATTLAAEGRGQGAAAGLISATTGATFVVGPVLGSALYELSPAVPSLAALATTLLAWVIALAMPAGAR